MQTISVRPYSNRPAMFIKSVAVLLVGAMTGSATIAEIIPSNRCVTWQGKVGIPGGVPQRTTIYKTLSPIGGGVDDAAAINNAILACPAGQVVKLAAGKFTINSSTPIRLKPSVTLRG